MYRVTSVKVDAVITLSTRVEVGSSMVEEFWLWYLEDTSDPTGHAPHMLQRPT